MKKLLLDICCAPCSTIAIERLQKEYDITLFFSNWNIHPEEEYKLRLNSARKLSTFLGLDLMVTNYEPDKWLVAVKGHESEPEGGSRCSICFEKRIEIAASFASLNNYDCFAVTLSVSPHKDTIKINGIGSLVSKKYNVQFLECDFTENEGFTKSVELSKKHELYRQKYCGCVYSKS